MIIRAINNLDVDAEKGYLAAVPTVGGTALYVRNVDNFYPSWAVQIGETGQELSEVLMLGAAAISGTTLNTVGTVKRYHPVDTVIYATKYDQIVFARSTAGTTGTPTVLTDGTKTITADSPYTLMDDTTGVSTYGYKCYYRNSVSGGTSAFSDWLTQAGYTFYSLYKLRERVRNKLFSAGFLKAGDTQINDWINEWLETMNNTAIDTNEDYSIGTVDVAYGTAGLGTISSSDFKEIRKMDITTDGINFYRATKKYTNEWYPGVTYIETHPYFSMEGDNVFRKLPNGTAGTARIAYYKMLTPLSNDTDELPVSMKPYTKTFIDYPLAQTYYLDGKADMGDRFMSFANTGRDEFKRQIAPRSKTGPQYITFTDVTSGEDLGEVY